MNLVPVKIPGGLVLLAVVAFCMLPLVELALLIASARTIGFWWTLLLCVVTGIAGSMLARWQGGQTLQRAREAMSRGELPGDALLDGVFVIVGGVLLMTPGFVTDLMGLIFLLPPTRAGLKALARRWWRRRSGVIEVRPIR